MGELNNPDKYELNLYITTGFATLSNKNYVDIDLMMATQGESAFYSFSLRALKVDYKDLYLCLDKLVKDTIEKFEKSFEEYPNVWKEKKTLTSQLRLLDILDRSCAEVERFLVPAINEIFIEHYE